MTPVPYELLPGLIDRVADWAVRVMETLGGPGAGLLVALENLFPPLPSELILPLAGFTAARGELSLVSALVWTTAGSVVGALVLYLLAGRLGLNRVRRVARRLPLVDVDDVDRTDAWFTRHGRPSVFFGRMVPMFRSLVSVPAGVNRMPLRWFLPLTALGSGLWNGLLVGAGYLLGERWHLVESYAGVAQKVVLGLVAVALIVFVVRRLRRRAD